MKSPSIYIPLDRRQALNRNKSLPTRTSGAALFTDISGFTLLTEALLKAYGPKRGSEEITRRLNQIYDALIAEVHRYGGSIIAFSGDAITCWLDGDDGLRATACGLAMQTIMSELAAIEMPSGEILSLAMKSAVATGPIRRFVVGDPQIQRIDVLAGATLDRMIAAECHAEKGEVLLDPQVVAQIKDKIEIIAWRKDPDTAQQFGVAGHLVAKHLLNLERNVPPTHSAEELIIDDQAEIRSWLLPPIYERLQAGKGDFLAELRPVVILFLNFSGIDYDRDEEAEFKLDAYIYWVQNILAQYEGYLLQLIIGDKGSYLYSAFGAPLAHEDDAVRAISAALDLQSAPPALNFINQVGIGISQGQIWTGAYGGAMRRTYGVLGHEVNVAARLMETATAGQILVKDIVRHATGNTFSWRALPPLRVKGNTELIKTFKVEGLKTQQATHLQEPNYALAMVGRQAELALLEQKLELMLTGRGQIITIVAEAGMGKSRLVAEFGHIAANQDLFTYGGECQSYGKNSSYLVWQSIWHNFFNLDPSWEIEERIKALEKQLDLVDPTLTPRLPLLGTVLNFSIFDNDLTRPFDPKLRKTSLESLLVDCLRHRSKQNPILLILKNCHWIDPLSHDLLATIGRAIVDLPVMLIVTYRPPHLDDFTLRVTQLPHFTEIPLADFTPQESEQLITLKLEQFFGNQTKVPATFIKRITDRAHGNPFYIEELLNYLRDQNLDLYDNKALSKLDLPDSLHSLILTRIDQLTEYQKSAIKIASVIGRLFAADWLWGMYPDLGAPEDVKADLEILSRLDLTPLDKPEPELTYMFKHRVIQEVTYESLPYATRAKLHDQLGQYLNQRYQDDLKRYINLLAFHYGRSNNSSKKRKFLRQAGEVAQAEYANEAAIDYYEQLLPLLPPAEQVTIMRRLGKVEQLMTQWNGAYIRYQQALALSEQSDDQLAQAWCQLDLGELFRLQGQYSESFVWLDKARSKFEMLGDLAGLGQVLHLEGTLAAQQGNLELAQTHYEESLTLRQQLKDQPKIADLLNNMGIVARYRGDYETAAILQKEALDLRYKLADKWAIALSLNNLGNVYLDQGNFFLAQTQLEVAVQVQRQLGDKYMLANFLHSLANVNRDQGDYHKAYAHYKESLIILWELGDRWLLANLLEDMGGLAALLGQAKRALQLPEAAAALRELINSPLSSTYQEKLDKMLEPARQALGEETSKTVKAKGRAMSLEQAINEALQIHLDPA